MVAVASETLIPTRNEDFVTVLRAARNLDTGALVFERVPSEVSGEVFDDLGRLERFVRARPRSTAGRSTSQAETPAKLARQDPGASRARS